MWLLYIAMLSQIEIEMVFGDYSAQWGFLGI
jgi:hypothetical protein